MLFVWRCGIDSARCAWRCGTDALTFRFLPINPRAPFFLGDEAGMYLLCLSLYRIVEKLQHQLLTEITFEALRTTKTQFQGLVTGWLRGRLSLRFCPENFNSGDFFLANFQPVASAVRGWLHVRFSSRSCDTTKFEKFASPARANPRLKAKNENTIACLRKLPSTKITINTIKHLIFFSMVSTTRRISQKN